MKFHYSDIYVNKISSSHYRAEVVECRTGTTHWADFESLKEAEAWVENKAHSVDMEFSTD